MQADRTVKGWREPITLGSALALAAAQQQAGNLEGAKGLYQQILLHRPGHPQALTMLGSIAYQQGNDERGDDLVEEAISALSRSLDGMPPTLPEQAGLANLLLARHRPKEAMKRLAKTVLPHFPVRSSEQNFVRLRDRARSAGRPSILMTAMPKSASESIGHRLATGLGLGQSHVSIGLFPHCCPVPGRLAAFAPGGILAKEHIGPEQYHVERLVESGIDRLLVHLRDPRQALLSWAHFVMEDVSRRMLAPIWRDIVPPAKILGSGLPDVIDWCLQHYLPLLIDFMLGWHRREQEPCPNLKVRCLTFESFVANQERYVTDALSFYDLACEDLKAGDQAPAIHFRRGRIDEWRQVFSKEQRRQADSALPDALVERFGWGS